ncbi:hypothetical protein [Legionella saoudiensis]|uniref:hypothetical protein n=1 Tax=Legionella saoudiensis TaxID=1750561 RepID=UPI000731867B|nr:hypothetical protein [Legionella saoudiensis]
MPIPVLALPLAAAAASSGGTSTGAAILTLLGLIGLGGGGYWWRRQSSSETDPEHVDSRNKQAHVLQKGRDGVQNDVAEVQEISKEFTDSIDSVELVEQQDASRQHADETKAMAELRRLLEIKDTALEHAQVENERLERLLIDKLSEVQDLQKVIDEQEVTIDGLSKSVEYQTETIIQLDKRAKAAWEMVRFFKQHKEAQPPQEQLPSIDNPQAAM